MSESERISIRDIEISDEVLKEWRKRVAEAFNEPDPDAREYDPRFPLADQSYAAQKDFYYKLKCMKAEQEYFDLMERKKQRGSV